MKYRLRSYAQAPPGGYPFVQERGIHREFKSEPLIEAQAQAVSSFRKANGLPRSSIAESLFDVDNYTCRRLQNADMWCIPSDGVSVALNATSPIIAPPCKGCGIPIT